MDYTRVAYLVKDVGTKCGANRKFANSLPEIQKLFADLMFVEAGVTPSMQASAIAYYLWSSNAYAYAYQDKFIIGL